MEQVTSAPDDGWVCEDCDEDMNKDRMIALLEANVEILQSAIRKHEKFYRDGYPVDAVQAGQVIPGYHLDLWQAGRQQ